MSEPIVGIRCIFVRPEIGVMELWLPAGADGLPPHDIQLAVNPPGRADFRIDIVNMVVKRVTYRYSHFVTTIELGHPGYFIYFQVD